MEVGKKRGRKRGKVEERWERENIYSGSDGEKTMLSRRRTDNKHLLSGAPETVVIQLDKVASGSRLDAVPLVNGNVPRGKGSCQKSGRCRFPRQAEKRECWVDRLSVYVSMFFFGSFFFFFFYFFRRLGIFAFCAFFREKKMLRKINFLFFFFQPNRIMLQHV